MGGKILEYEARTIRIKGIEEGIEEGRVQLLQSLVQTKLRKGKSVEIIAEELEIGVMEIQKIIDQIKKS